MPRPARLPLLLIALAIAATEAFAASRYDRLRTMRVAPGDPITAAFAARQRADGFNTLLFSDTTRYDPVSKRWTRATEAEIADALALARSFEMSVVLCVAAVEQIPNAEHAFLLDDELRERLALWQRHDRGEVIGAFFLPDDAFFLRVPKEAQLRWLAIAREAFPTLPILGMAGEFALAMTAGERALYWSPDAFDALVLLMYPYHLGHVWGRTLDHVGDPDPDASLVRYVRDYIAACREALLRDLGPRQLVIPVVQTFFYAGEPRGRIPRVEDITLQVRTIHAELQRTLGQRTNFAMAYFFAGTADAGSVALPVPEGIYDVSGWPDAVAAENRWLRDRMRYGRGAGQTGAPLPSPEPKT